MDLEKAIASLEESQPARKVKLSIHPLEFKLISNPNQQDIITSEKNWHNTIILGDCSKVLQQIPSNIADLIVTSPPYADSRKKPMAGLIQMIMSNGFFPFLKNCTEF